MVPEDRGYTGRIGPSEAAFRCNTKFGNNTLSRRDTCSITGFVVELQQPEIQLCSWGAPPTAEWSEERIPGLLRDRNVDEFNPPFHEVCDAVHQLDQHRCILQPQERLVAR